jgi:hypothetical protein
MLVSGKKESRMIAVHSWEKLIANKFNALALVGNTRTAKNKQELRGFPICFNNSYSRESILKSLSLSVITG